MVPHMGGGYSYQPGFAYGTGFPSQQMGGAGSYEQQQPQQQLLALPGPSQPGAQARLQGPPAYGMPGSSRQNPRWLPTFSKRQSGTHRMHEHQPCPHAEPSTMRCTRKAPGGVCIGYGVLVMDAAPPSDVPTGRDAYSLTPACGCDRLPQGEGPHG